MANVLNVKRGPVAKVEWSKQYLLVIYHQSRAYHSIQHTVSKNKTQIHANMYFDTDKGSLVWVIYLCYVIMWDNSVGCWPHENYFLPHTMECVLITKRRHLAISFDNVHKTWWLCTVHMKTFLQGKWMDTASSSWLGPNSLTRDHYHCAPLVVDNNGWTT